MNYFNEILKPNLFVSFIQVILGIILPRLKDLIITKESFNNKYDKLKQSIFHKLTICYAEQINFIIEKPSIKNNSDYSISEKELEFTKKNINFIICNIKLQDISFKILKYHNCLFYCLIIGIMLLIISFFSPLIVEQTINFILLIFSFILIIIQIYSAININLYDKKFRKLENKIYHEI